MKFQLLDLPQEVLDAGKLLYQCYVENMGWSPPVGNPSEQMVIDSPSGKYLTDRFQKSSIWFGVYDEKTLLACGRLIKPTGPGLEYNLYRSDIPIKVTANTFEMNRIAVRSGFEGSPALVALIQGIIAFAVQKKIDTLLTTLAFPQPAETMIQLGWETVDNSNFKYHASDFKEVHLFSFDLKDGLRAEKLNNLVKMIRAA